MPRSSPAGKAWIATRLSAVDAVKHVLDIGVGAGTYHSLFAGLLPGALWTGVEAWAPYVEEFGLTSRYDRLIIQDVTKLDLSRIEPADICFCGDVLEHMDLADAVTLVHTLTKLCRLLFISVPLGYCPQGAVGGNPYEKHIVEHFTEELVRNTFKPIIDGNISSHESWTIGVFALSTDRRVAANILQLAAA